MKKWEKFELHVKEQVSGILDQMYETSLMGGSNSTDPDLIIRKNEQKFIFEIKLLPSQAGQIVVKQNGDNLHATSAKDNPYTMCVIEAVEKGVVDNELAQQWVMWKYSEANGIIFGNFDEIYVNQVDTMNKYLDFSWNFRAKKSGTRKLTKEISEKYEDLFIKKRNRWFLKENKEKEFNTIKKIENLYKNQEQEVRIMSNTKNWNVVFTANFKKDVKREAFQSLSEIQSLLT